MTVTDKIVALLPMKANSERVVGKNFRHFNGKPLFRWMLDTLLAVAEIREVVINTDARHILADNGLVESERVRIRDRRLGITMLMLQFGIFVYVFVRATPRSRGQMSQMELPFSRRYAQAWKRESSSTSPWPMVLASLRINSL